MVTLVFLIVLGAGIFALFRFYDARRQQRDSIRASLHAAAKALRGDLEPNPQRRGRQRVTFDEQGHRFALSREQAPGDDTVMQNIFVVEALHTSCSFNFDLRACRTRLTTQTDGAAAEPPDHELAEQNIDFSGDEISRKHFSRLIGDQDNKRLLTYALDHKDARLHFAPSGSWFECAGFSDNGELVAATARTAARALAIFLTPTATTKK